LIVRNRDIVFTVLFGDEKYVIQTYEGEYRNLMALIADKIVAENFGECKGMGRCGTCMATIANWKIKAPSKERNEEVTLSKCSPDNEDVRLSCQILITENLSDSTVHIKDESA
jgi:ferredoxin, 2Fe-2S